ncbi:hypothetical protein ACHAPJ_001299 [Fusarium lateritium]
MAFLRGTLIKLYTKAQDILDRSERAWLAACEAWNEEPNPQATTITTTTTAAEAQQVPTSTPIPTLTPVPVPIPAPSLAPAPAPASVSVPVEITKATPPLIKTEANDVSGNKVIATSRGETTASFRLGSSAEVFVKPSARALERAFAADVSNNASQLIIWTDASHGSRRTAASGGAAAFRNGLTWVRIAERRHNVRSTELAELQAIELALEYAVQVVKQAKIHNEPLKVVEIFSDSQAALIQLGQGARPRKCKGRRQEQIVATKTLQVVEFKINVLQEAGVTMEFHWVPRDRFMGNILADAGAGLARLGIGTGFNKPDHVVIELMRKHNEEVYEMFKSERPGTFKRATVLRTRMADEVATVSALTSNLNKDASL